MVTTLTDIKYTFPSATVQIVNTMSHNILHILDVVVITTYLNIKEGRLKEKSRLL